MEFYLHFRVCCMAYTQITLPSFSTFMVTVLLSKVLLFVAVAQYSDGVLYQVQGTKHPQIFAFHPLKLKQTCAFVCVLSWTN